MDISDVYEIANMIYGDSQDELRAIFEQMSQDQRMPDNAIARNLVIMLICDTIETDGLVIMSSS